ncbi:Ribonuclease VapC37 [subsurface metagenome]
MRVPDINLLIYAINLDTPYHEKARAWLEQSLSGREPVGFTWIVILGFLRIVTHGSIMTHPLSPETAFEVIDGWLRQPIVQIIEPSNQHWQLFKELLSQLGTAGNLTSDAHLAALAIEHAACLYSTDNDFSRFRSLRWKNPLQEES